jgi:hypothetical protein
MLDGIQNGNDKQVERPGEPTQEGPQVPPDAAPVKEEAKQQNQAIIKDGVMDVRIYLENSEVAFACAVGSLDLAKDLVKNYFGKKALQEAAQKAVLTNKIIRPTLQ